MCGVAVLSGQDLGKKLQGQSCAVQEDHAEYTGTILFMLETGQNIKTNVRDLFHHGNDVIVAMVTCLCGGPSYVWIRP